MDAAKTFIVTGCASGLGQRLAERLVEQGHRVLATDLRPGPLEELAAAQNWPSERVRVRRMDVCRPIEWGAVVENACNLFGSLDVVINCAGYLNSQPVSELHEVEIHHHFDVNTKGVIFGTQAAARRMLEFGGGHIIHIASIAGLAPIPGMSLYSSAKAAARHFALCAAHELKPFNIAVTVVSPDSIDSPMLERQEKNPSAALMFSCPSFLQVDTVADAILGDVLTKRPLEYHIPSGRCRLARWANLFPSLGFRLIPRFWRRGAERQMERTLARAAKTNL